MARIPRQLAGIGASDLTDVAEFDAYVGPNREVTVDPERGIIALHDGETTGGLQFRVLENVENLSPEQLVTEGPIAEAIDLKADAAALTAAITTINNSLNTSIAALPMFFSGTGSPETVITGDPGDVYYQNDATPVELRYWVKLGGFANKVNWRQLYTDIPFLADGSNEATKLIGRTGQVDLKGRAVRFDTDNMNVDFVHGFRFVENVEGGANGRDGYYPVDAGSLRSSKTVLIPAGAYNAWAEDMHHTYKGERFAIVHYNHKGHAGAGAIVCYRTRGDNLWGQREELWGPSDGTLYTTEDLQAGYMAASAGILDGHQFILISNNISDGEELRDWRMMRRRLGESFEMENKIFVVNKSGLKLAIRKSDMNFPASRGMLFKFFQNALPTPVANVTFDNGFYIVTDVDNNNVFFTSVLAPIVPTSIPANPGGGRVRVMIDEEPFSEVLFTGGISFGAMFKLVAGSTGQPAYPTSFAADTRHIGNSGRLFFAGSVAPSMPYMVRCEGIHNARGTSYATMFTAATGMSNIPADLAGPSFDWHDDGTTYGELVGTLRTRNAGTGPAIFYMSGELQGALGGQPVFKRYANGVSLNCILACRVSKNYGKGKKIIISASSGRDKVLPDGATHFQLDHWIVVADLAEFKAMAPTSNTDDLNKVFKWYNIGSLTNYDIHGIFNDGEKTQSGGVGSLCLMDNGMVASIMTAASASTDAIDGPLSCSHYIWKVDIAKLVGLRTVADMSPDVVPFLNHHHIQHSQNPLTTTTSPTNAVFRCTKRDWDVSNGDYDYNNGRYTPRITGDYEFTVTVEPTGDNTEFWLELWYMDGGTPLSPYLHAFSSNPGPRKLCRAKLPVGAIMMVQQTFRAYLRAGQTVALRVMSGSAAASLNSEIAIKRAS